MKTSLLCGLAPLALASAAVAQPTVFATEGATMYRFQLGGAAQSFDMGDTLIGMTARPDQTLLASSQVDTGQNTPEFYDIFNPLGNPPVLSGTGLQLPYTVSCLTLANGLVYGVGGDALYSFDPNNAYAPTLIGPTGLTDVGGLVYDAGSDSLIVLDNDADALFPLSWVDGSAGAAIGPLGIDSLSSGMEFFNGVLYAAVQNGTSNAFELGTINLNTGAYTTTQAIHAGAAQATTAVAIIPAPGALAAMGLGLLAGRRRRR